MESSTLMLNVKNEANKNYDLQKKLLDFHTKPGQTLYSREKRSLVTRNKTGLINTDRQKRPRIARHNDCHDVVIKF